MSDTGAPADPSASTLIDADVLWRAFDSDAPQHSEALSLLERVRDAQEPIAVTEGILGEIYAQLTHPKRSRAADPQQVTAEIEKLLNWPNLLVLQPDEGATRLAFALAAREELRGQEIHDARHAAAAISVGLTRVYTYNVADWLRYFDDGLTIAGPPSSVEKARELLDRVK